MEKGEPSDGDASWTKFITVQQGAPGSIVFRGDLYWQKWLGPWITVLLGYWLEPS